MSSYEGVSHLLCTPRRAAPPISTMAELSSCCSCCCKPHQGEADFHLGETAPASQRRINRKLKEQPGGEGKEQPACNPLQSQGELDRQERVYSHCVKQYLFASFVILFKYRQDGNSSYGQCTRTKAQKLISGLFPPTFRTLHSFAGFYPQQLFFASLLGLFFLSHSPGKLLALLCFPGLGVNTQPP